MSGFTSWRAEWRLRAIMAALALFMTTLSAGGAAADGGDNNDGGSFTLTILHNGRPGPNDAIEGG